MATLLATRTARRRGMLYLALVVIALGLMAFSSTPGMRDVQLALRFALTPIQRGLDEVASGVASIGTAIAEMDQLRAQNRTLNDENERLRNEQARLEEIRRENELLTGLLQVRNGLDHETVTAQVIGRESLEFRREVTIDKGSDDGIAVGDVVIADGGALAGRVVNVGPSAASILLIGDQRSTVIGQLATSDATGTVVGQGQVGGALVMSNIPSNEEVHEGEEVFTAGIQLEGGFRSPFPKGLLIGQVVDVRRDPNAVVQTAFLVPAANIDKLEYALVITDYEGGLPSIGDQPVDCEEGDGDTLPDDDRPCATPSQRPSASPSPPG